MMKALLIAAILFVWGHSAFSDELRVGMSVNTPYQVDGRGSMTGSVAGVIECSIEKLKIPYNIYVYPWKRSLDSFKRANIDIIFSFEKNTELDKIATFTTPLVLESWFWYWQKNERYNKDAVVAVVLGSNQERWLLDNGYTNVHTVLRLDQALGLLNIGRVSAVLSDDAQMRLTSERTGISNSRFNKKFIRFSTLGAYVSNDYIQDYPSIVGVLNDHIESCQPVGVKLNDSFRIALYDNIDDIIEITKNNLLIDTIKASNIELQGIELETIKRLDERWINEKKSGEHTLIRKIMSNPLSNYLHDVKHSSDNLYTEIFVTNEYGLNVGQSDVTSDYWQGDESKFINTFGIRSKTPFVDDIVYDISSHSFQSQISISVLSEDKPIGSITVGINVEEALKRYSRLNIE